jgi:hypothetical protein
MFYNVYDKSGEMIDAIELSNSEKESYKKQNPDHDLVAADELLPDEDFYDEWK